MVSRWSRRECQDLNDVEQLAEVSSFRYFNAIVPAGGGVELLRGN